MKLKKKKRIISFFFFCHLNRKIKQPVQSRETEFWEGRASFPLWDSGVASDLSPPGFSAVFGEEAQD